MKILTKNAISLSLAAMTGVFSMNSPVFAATSASTSITANIVGGSCDIAAPATVSIMDGEPISAASITPTSDISDTFDLTLSGCKGFGLTPSISIVGDANNDSGTNLFVSSSSTSKGYGILLSTTGNTNFAASTNLAATKNIAAVTKTWGNTQASTLNGTLPLKAVVSCGTCTASTLQGGILNASLTFNFVYQ